MALDGKSVVVTGGVGFVGNCVVATLLKRTRRTEIVVLDNLFNGRREYLPDSPRVRLCEVDMRDGRDVLAAMAAARPHVVIHLAALHFIPYCNAHPAEAVDVNVLGTQHVLEACRETEPEIVAVASTAAVYAVNDGPSDEQSPIEPVDIYGLTKSINEQQLRLHSRQTESRCAVARFSNVIGPRETNPHVLPAIVEQMIEGRDALALGNVKPKRDYIYVEDVADALITICQRQTARYQVYNVSTGQEHSVEEIVEVLQQITGRPLRIEVDPERVRKSDRMHLLCIPKQLKLDFGWKPSYSLRRGLEAIWAHERHEGSTREASVAKSAPPILSGSALAKCTNRAARAPRPAGQP